MLDIKVQRMYRFETDRPLKAFVDITINDVLLIKGCRVMQGSHELFVSMPREQAKDSKWYDSVRCLTQEVRDEITEVVLDAYTEDMDEDSGNRTCDDIEETEPYKNDGLLVEE